MLQHMIHCAIYSHVISRLLLENLLTLVGSVICNIHYIHIYIYINIIFFHPRCDLYHEKKAKIKLHIIIMHLPKFIIIIIFISLSILQICTCSFTYINERRQYNSCINLSLCVCLWWDSISFQGRCFYFHRKWILKKIKSFSFTSL